MGEWSADEAIGVAARLLADESDQVIAGGQAALDQDDEAARTALVDRFWYDQCQREGWPCMGGQ